MTRRTPRDRFKIPEQNFGVSLMFPDFLCRADLSWEPSDEQVRTLTADMERAVIAKQNEPGWTAKARGVKIINNHDGTWTVAAAVRVIPKAI